MAARQNRARKRNNSALKTIFLAIAVIALFYGCGYFAFRLAGQGACKDNSSFGKPISELGNLLYVKTNPTLMAVEKSYEGMDISFNPQYHIPNWVAWELTGQETDGPVTRTNKFSADPDMEGCGESWDYSYSGYDRGHMAPAGDMKWSKKAMDETFFMTNICPQAKVLNTGSWKRLEEKCRQWALADSSIYIICGPIIDGKPVEYIGDSKVYVPSAFFKVILSPYSNPARGIGFIMPNSKPKGGMQECAVSIDSVEAVTGHDFFSSLPDEIENEVESQCDFHYWSTHGSRKK